MREGSKPKWMRRPAFFHSPSSSSAISAKPQRTQRLSFFAPGRYCLLASLLSLLLIPLSLAQTSRPLPDHVPPKRSSQIHDGFGINSDLPRNPYLPWNRWWWTRMFDAGFKWARIGQYENSSDRTSWDWIEQKRGVFSSSPELEDAVNSLVDHLAGANRGVAHEIERA